MAKKPLVYELKKKIFIGFFCMEEALWVTLLPHLSSVEGLNPTPPLHITCFPYATNFLPQSKDIQLSYLSSWEVYSLKNVLWAE